MSSVNSENRKRERRRVRAVAREYQKKGYAVVVGPGADDLPDFLKNCRPDLLATNDRERVVVEVKSRQSLSEPPSLTEIAHALEGKPGWRFEFVMTNPADEGEEDKLNLLPLTLPQKLLTPQKIRERLDQARRLAEGSEHGEAALLFAWSVAEAALRLVADREGLSVGASSPVSAIKKLYSMGLMDRDDYELLLSSAPIRNAIVHGFDAERLDTASVDQILAVADRLLREVGVSLK